MSTMGAWLTMVNHVHTMVDHAKLCHNHALTIVNHGRFVKCHPSSTMVEPVVDPG